MIKLYKHTVGRDDDAADTLQIPLQRTHSAGRTEYVL